MKPVTTALKEVLNELGIDRGNNGTYSDSRTPEEGVKAVSVKFCGLNIDPESELGKMIVIKMKERGYVFHYATSMDDPKRQTQHWSLNGVRFTFSIPQ